MSIIWTLWIGDRFDDMLRNRFVCGVNQESTHLLLLTPVWSIVKWNKWSIITLVGKALHIALSLESVINQSLDRTYSSCFMRAIIARMRLPFFKIFSNFVHFCQNFILPFFCPFLRFFWKIARMPFLSRIGPATNQDEESLTECIWWWCRGFENRTKSACVFVVMETIYQTHVVILTRSVSFGKTRDILPKLAERKRTDCMKESSY